MFQAEVAKVEKEEKEVVVPVEKAAEVVASPVATVEKAAEQWKSR